ncbi:MAG: VUT family protein, partial [Rhizobium sp.]|nr:VUT family protein [Rhizobium sp.]
MLKTHYILAYSLLMTAIVVASNILVQYPLSG